MKLPPWDLVYGPGWADSLAAVCAVRDRVDWNLEGYGDAVTTFPLKYSRPLMAGVDDEKVRYGTTKDVAEGYRLVIFVSLDKSLKRVTLQWIESEDLDEDE